jgi:predicted TIM-barrel fold metal-dependent hydrolase
MPYVKWPSTTPHKEPHEEYVEMNESRRRFLKRTLTATTACGLARLVWANDAAPTEPITDTHVYIGHWPHQQLPNSDPTTLVSTLRRVGVRSAWVGSFDGLFHKDIASVNQRLADTCARMGDGLLIPVGSINPKLPDWEDDIRRCHDTFRMPGIRLHPNYHGYTLDDSHFARLLELAAAYGLVVQLVAWIESEHHLLLNPRVAHVDLKPLAEKIATFPKLKLLIANGYGAADDIDISALLPLKPIYFDFARAGATNDVRQLVEKTSPNRVVFGSGMPLHDIDPVILKMQQAHLTDGNRQAVTMLNASRLVTASPIH